MERMARTFFYDIDASVSTQNASLYILLDKPNFVPIPSQNREPAEGGKG